MTSSHYTWSHGAVIRGPRDARRLALVFTGGDFGEGTGQVLEALREAGAPGSFFFTGGFLGDQANRAAVELALADGHYVGPHSHEHLLYCPWDDRSQTLVSRDEFHRDLEANLAALAEFGVARERLKWWIPPFEWYNQTIVDWSVEAGLRLFCFTPGTLSHTDYTTTDDPHYCCSDGIHASVVGYESSAPDGLNGFLLLTHVGAGPGRTDKYFARLGSLLHELVERGYELVSVESLLADAPTGEGLP